MGPCGAAMLMWYEHDQLAKVSTEQAIHYTSTKPLHAETTG